MKRGSPPQEEGRARGRETSRPMVSTPARPEAGAGSETTEKDGDWNWETETTSADLIALWTLPGQPGESGEDLEFCPLPCSEQPRNAGSTLLASEDAPAIGAAAHRSSQAPTSKGNAPTHRANRPAIRRTRIGVTLTPVHRERFQRLASADWTQTG